MGNATTLRPQTESAARLQVKSLVFADVTHVADEQLVRSLMSKSVQEFTGVTAATGLPDIDYFDAGGYALLRRMSIYPEQAVATATKKCFENIVAPLSAGLRERLRGLVGKPETRFAEIGNKLVEGSSLDTPGEAAISDGYLPAMLAYSLYQGQEAPKPLLAGETNTRAALEQATQALGEWEKNYLDLARFFLHDKWFDGQSLIDIMIGYWGRDYGFADIDLEVMPLGFPDGYYNAAHAGVQLIEPLNDAGTELMAKLSTVRVIELLAHHPMSIDVEIGGEKDALQVVSWNRLQDFALMRRKPGVVVDAGVPLLGLVELLVHEFTHHVFHMLDTSNGMVRNGAVCLLNQAVINEGFAEYHTWQMLRSVFERFPQFNYFRLLRRAAHFSEDTSDAHVAGAALFSSWAPDEICRNPFQIGKPKGIVEVTASNWHATPVVEMHIATDRTGKELTIEKVLIPNNDWIAVTKKAAMARNFDFWL